MANDNVDLSEKSVKINLINDGSIKVSVEVTVVDFHFWWVVGIDGRGGRLYSGNDKNRKQMIYYLVLDDM